MSDVGLVLAEGVGDEGDSKDRFVESPASEEGALFSSSALKPNSSSVLSSTPQSSASELISDVLTGDSGSANGDCSGRKLTIVHGNEFESSISSGDIVSIDDSE